MSAYTIRPAVDICDAPCFEVVDERGAVCAIRYTRKHAEEWARRAPVREAAPVAEDDAALSLEQLGELMCKASNDNL